MPKPDRITISLYSKQVISDPKDKDQRGFNASALEQVANIKRMRDAFAYAAGLMGRRPPEIVVSMLLVPEWSKGKSYSSADYAEAKRAFFALARATLDKAGLSDVVIEDYYEKASADEKGYLDHLEALGSCADMIKTGAIISPDNADRHHLQVDSNTQLHDVEAFYGDTFGSSTSHDHLVLLNASYYDDDYVSAHNKVVFTFPGSTFPVVLRRTHLDYCREHQDDHRSADPVRVREKKTKNSIYARDFVVALSEEALTVRVSIGPRTIYPAVLKRPEYGLTGHVITAVNRSWGPGVEESEEVKALKKLKVTFSVGDALCDYASFCNAIKKHTECLSAHRYRAESSGDAARAIDDTEAREDFLRISNPVVEKVVIARFCEHAIDAIERSEHAAAHKATLMKTVASYFPDTERGNALTQDLFGCSVKEFIADPKKYAKHHRFVGEDAYIREELARLEAHISYLSARPPSDPARRYHYQEALSSLEKQRTELQAEYALHRFASFTDGQLSDRAGECELVTSGTVAATKATQERSRIELAVIRMEIDKRASRRLGSTASTRFASETDYAEGGGSRPTMSGAGDTMPPPASVPEATSGSATGAYKDRLTAAKGGGESERKEPPSMPRRH